MSLRCSLAHLSMSCLVETVHHGFIPIIYTLPTQYESKKQLQDRSVKSFYGPLDYLYSSAIWTCLVSLAPLALSSCLQEAHEA